MSNKPIKWGMVVKSFLLLLLVALTSVAANIFKLKGEKESLIESLNTTIAHADVPYSEASYYGESGYGGGTGSGDSGSGGGSEGGGGASGGATGAGTCSGTCGTTASGTCASGK